MHTGWYDKIPKRILKHRLKVKSGCIKWGYRKGIVTPLIMKSCHGRHAPFAKENEREKSGTRAGSSPVCCVYISCIFMVHIYMVASEWWRGTHADSDQVVWRGSMGVHIGVSRTGTGSCHVSTMQKVNERERESLMSCTRATAIRGDQEPHGPYSHGITIGLGINHYTLTWRIFSFPKSYTLYIYSLPFHTTVISLLFVEFVPYLHLHLSIDRH